MALPPNLSQQEFNNALAEFRQAVGNDWVFSSDEDVALYRDSYSIYWGEEEERIVLASSFRCPSEPERYSWMFVVPP